MDTTKANLAMPIAIVIAGIAIGGAIIYSNSATGGNDTESNNPNNSQSGFVAGIPTSVVDKLGIDQDEFAACMEQDDIADRVSLEHTTSTSLGLRGTPHSIVMLEDGTNYRINGAYPYDTVAITIEAALAGVNAETIQNFLDLFQAQGTTEEDINAFAQENLIPAIAARQSTETSPLPAQEPAGERLSQRDKDLIEAVGHVQGDENAPVQLVEFSDLECPFCARYHITMKQLMADYGETGELSWKYVHFMPFDSRPDAHPNARAQAEGAECAAVLAGEEAYWDYLDEIFLYNSSQ